MAQLRPDASADPSGAGERELLLAGCAKRDGMRGPLAHARRVFSGAYDGVPGLVIDRYLDWTTLEISRPELMRHVETWAACLSELGVRGTYLKQRVRADLRRVDQSALCPSEPLWGEPAPAPLWVREGALELAVRLDDGLSTGLFLDQRGNRELLLGEVGGQRVLNLFAYTGAFTVAAAVGGASETVSVDLSKRALARGRENLTQNIGAFDPTRHRFVADDALAFLPRMQRRGERFGWIVLDPPSFATRGKAVFRVARDLGDIAAQCLTLLGPSGNLLCVTNHQGTSRADLESMLRASAVQAGREVTRLQPLSAPEDCRSEPADAETKGFRVQVR